MGEVEKKVYRVEEVAIIMDVSPKTVYRMLEAGEIPGAVKLGHIWRIPKKVVDKWVDPFDDDDSEETT